MNNNAIGVFDSGLGGLTCVRELNRLLPAEDIVYFGDTARIPYGTRSRKTVMSYAAQDAAFIKRHNVKIIIAACGTVSSVAAEDESFAGDTLFTGVVLPAARAACAATKNGKIGVIGTSATVRTGAYEKAVRSICPGFEVIGVACPLFVPLVENGFAVPGDPVTALVADRYLAPLKSAGVDVLILGCTHYPLMEDAIRSCVGGDVALISSGAEAAKYACTLLTSLKMLNGSEGGGTNTYYTSDSARMFAESASLYLGGEVNGKVIKVSLEELTRFQA